MRPHLSGARGAFTSADKGPARYRSRRTPNRRPALAHAPFEPRRKAHARSTCKGSTPRGRRRALAITSTAPSSRGRLRRLLGGRARGVGPLGCGLDGQCLGGPRLAAGRRRLRRRPRRPGSARASGSSSTTVPPGTSRGSKNASAGRGGLEEGARAALDDRRCLGGYAVRVGWWYHPVRGESEVKRWS